MSNPRFSSGEINLSAQNNERILPKVTTELSPFAEIVSPYELDTKGVTDTLAILDMPTAMPIHIVAGMKGETTPFKEEKDGVTYHYINVLHDKDTDPRDINGLPKQFKSNSGRHPDFVREREQNLAVTRALADMALHYTHPLTLDEETLTPSGANSNDKRLITPYEAKRATSIAQAIGFYIFMGSNSYPSIAEKYTDYVAVPSVIGLGVITAIAARQHMQSLKTKYSDEAIKKREIQLRSRQRAQRKAYTDNTVSDLAVYIDNIKVR